LRIAQHLDSLSFLPTIRFQGDKEISKLFREINYAIKQTALESSRRRGCEGDEARIPEIPKIT